MGTVTNPKKSVRAARPSSPKRSANAGANRGVTRDKTISAAARLSGIAADNSNTAPPPPRPLRRKVARADHSSTETRSRARTISAPSADAALITPAQDAHGSPLKNANSPRPSTASALLRSASSNSISSGTGAGVFLRPNGPDTERVYHAVAKCRWCGGRFTKYFHQWVCEHSDCANRQFAHAIRLAQPIDGQSPLLFLPLPLQVDIEEHPARRLLAWGPAGISKSYGGRMHLYARARKIAGYQALLLRCTYDQLEKNHLRYMDREAHLLGDAEYKSGNQKRMVFDNGSEIRFGFCDNESDIKHQSLGPDWDEILLDEAANFLPRAVQEIMARDRGNTLSLASREALGGITGRVRLLSNIGGRAWMYLDDFFIMQAPDRDEFPEYDAKYYGSITGGIEDNPYLDADYEQATLGGLEGARFQQLAKGNRFAFPDQFFAAFDPALHVRESAR